MPTGVEPSISKFLIHLQHCREQWCYIILFSIVVFPSLPVFYSHAHMHTHTHAHALMQCISTCACMHAWPGMSAAGRQALALATARGPRVLS